jgi:hypothetical protein
MSTVSEHADDDELEDQRQCVILATLIVKPPESMVTISSLPSSFTNTIKPVKIRPKNAHLCYDLANLALFLLKN